MDRILTGIFGGSFNPPHIGHLLVISDIAIKYAFREIYFVPTKIPPHKDKSFLSDANHRLNMLKIAVKDLTTAKISSFEIENEGISYSWLTINHFINHYGIKPQHLFFILGIDAFMLIKTWKNYPQILDMCNFLILSRPMDSNYKNILAKLNQRFPILPFDSYSPSDNCTRIYITDNILIDISSSQIRDRVKKDLSIRYLVPPEVEEYIKINNLYKKYKKE